jgi:DNA-binding NtrC family response regulator
MKRIYTLASSVAQTNAPVLIIGESGTGKELLADAIHRESKRRDEEFIPINTGAIAKELVASELFGHEKGAFTGAAYRKRGTFEIASAGTLFLDEISTMDPQTQISLLRVLEQHRFQRVGGSRYLKSNARVICATNENLEKAIADGRFRRDLFYRLNVFPIRIPPLRERGEDILLIARHYLREASVKNKLGKRELSSETERLLLEMPWNGNVRELKNVMFRAAIVATEETVQPEDIQQDHDFALPDQTVRRDVPIEVGSSIADAERTLISHTLQSVGGNKVEAAKLLGVSRKSLYNKIHQYEIANAIEN